MLNKITFYLIPLTLTLALPHLVEAKNKPGQTGTQAIKEKTQKDRSEKGAFILSVAGVANNQISDLPSEGQESTRVNAGGAILIETMIKDFFGLETGLIYLQRQYEINRQDARAVRQVDRLQVPLLARFWAGNFLSLAGGPYISFRMGGTERALSVGGTDGVTIKTTADEDVEVGLSVAATLNLAVAQRTGLFLEGRYLAPFQEEPDESANQISALAGIKFDM